MAGTIVGSNLTVIFRMLILVPYHHGNWGTGCFSFKYTGKNFHRIGFVSLGCKFGLSRFSAVEIFLNILFAKLQSGRAAIHNDTDSFAVGFAPCSDSEYISKWRSCHNFLLRYKAFSYHSIMNLKLNSQGTYDIFFIGCIYVTSVLAEGNFKWADVQR